MEQCQTHVNQTGGLIHLPHLMESTLQSTGQNSYSSNLCKDKGHKLNPNDPRCRLSSIVCWTRPLSSEPWTKAIDLYKQVQMLALKNVWQTVPAMLRVNYIGCHIPTTGGCDENPFRGDGHIRPGDFWVKK